MPSSLNRILIGVDVPLEESLSPLTRQGRAAILQAALDAIHAGQPAYYWDNEELDFIGPDRKNEV